MGLDITLVLYEYPFNEGIRTMLRLEQLFGRLDLLVARDDPVDHHFALATLFEVMDVTETIQQMIVGRATSTQIQKQAVAEGMITMRQDGYLKALQGITTLEEVNRVTADTA